MKGDQIEILIKNLIAEGNLWEALKTGIKYFPSNQTFLNLTWRYKDIEKQNNKGLLYSEQYIVERNKIALALISSLFPIKAQVNYRRKLSGYIHISWLFFVTPFLDLGKIKAVVITSTICFTAILAIAVPVIKFPKIPPGQPGIIVKLALHEDKVGKDNSRQNSTFDATESKGSMQEINDFNKPNKLKPHNEPIQKKEVNKNAFLDIQTNRKTRSGSTEFIRQDEDSPQLTEEEIIKKEADALKEQIGGIFFEDGKRNDGRIISDNQGDPSSVKPTYNFNDSGTVSGGLRSRRIIDTPKVVYNSQSQGTIAIKVCVNGDGKVVSANYTQRGSTTGNLSLKKIAIQNAKKWLFAKSNLNKQCGTITYRFKIT